MKSVKSVSIDIENILKVERLVEAKKFRSFSEFVNDALNTQLQNEDVIHEINAI